MNLELLTIFELSFKKAQINGLLNLPPKRALK